MKKNNQNIVKINFAKYHDKILFVPLGGSGEIGMNMNLYHYKGKWIIVDVGVGFAEDNMPGIDMILPEMSFLNEIKKDLLAVILTHAHEDHCGAIAYFVEKFSNIPIYTTEFTANFIKEKLIEKKLDQKAQIKKISTEQKINIGDFSILPLYLTHSIPEMNALIILCGKQQIVHTGDWKIDDTPVIGDTINYNLIENIAEKEILAVVGDSTNVLDKGTSGSEAELEKDITEICQENKHGMTLITTFASNVARIHTIHQIARKCNKKIALVGRSLNRIHKVASNSGYLQELQKDLILEEDIKNYPRNKLVVLCTGCQGEEKAALSKIACGKHKYIKVNQNDTVVFSSKIIPGNEKKIFAIINQFVKQDLKIVTEKNKNIHVSGHPCRDELIKLYNYLKPNILVPTHGELIHMKAHQKLGQELNIPNNLLISDGDCLMLEKNNPKIVGKVKVGYYGIDNQLLHHPEGEVMQTRRLIQKHGMLIVAVVINEKNPSNFNVEIKTPAALNYKEHKEIQNILLKHAKEIITKTVVAKKYKKTQGKLQLFRKRKEHLNTVINNVEQTLIRQMKKIYKKQVGDDIQILVIVQKSP